MVTSIKRIQDTEQIGLGEAFKMAISFTLGVAVDVAMTMAFGKLIPGGKGLKKWLAKAGVFVVSMMVGEKAEEYCYESMDNLKEMYMESQRMLIAAKEPDIEIVEVKDSGK